jgi:hypothetical protein
VLEQVTNGLAIRMAVMERALKAENEIRNEAPADKSPPAKRIKGGRA